MRECRNAIGLIALRDRSILEVSPNASTLTGIPVAASAPIDLARVVAPRAVHQALGLLSDGVLDACRMVTTRAAPGGAAVMASLRVVARDANQAYAIALFTTSEREAAPVFDGFIASLADFADERWPMHRTAETGGGIAQAFPEFDDLTDRQLEILERLARGDRVPTISRAMHLAASTIRNHLTTLYRKVGVHSQTELIEYLHASRPTPIGRRGTTPDQ